jgi:uncharacterized protein DUF6292
LATKHATTYRVDMTGQTDSARSLSRGLAGYLHAVAEAIGVPAEGTSFEISDTATAYLALAPRWSERPGADLMLVWAEQHGWAVAVETDPADEPEVIAYLGGDDLVPEPSTVARFVTDVVAGGGAGGRRPAFPTRDNRRDLGDRLARYA